jgi:hypothetical protein
VDSAIVDQTTSARAARDNTDQECKEKCANRYGGSAINTFGCYIDCKERNRDRSLEKVDDARQVRSTRFEQCKENCIRDNGYTFLTAPCIHGCYYGGRSMEVVSSKREVRGTDDCRFQCYSTHGYTMEAIGCMNNNCNRRSLEHSPADFTGPMNPFSSPAQHINPGQLLRNANKTLI